jgi:hypothetical protein
MEVHIPEDSKYAKALRILYETGGNFQTKPTHILLVSVFHFAAFVHAGIIEPDERYERLVRKGVIRPRQMRGIGRGRTKTPPLPGRSRKP